jgi:hypothetical protein
VISYRQNAGLAHSVAPPLALAFMVASNFCFVVHGPAELRLVCGHRVRDKSYLKASILDHGITHCSTRGSITVAQEASEEAKDQGNRRVSTGSEEKEYTQVDSNH